MLLKTITTADDGVTEEKYYNLKGDYTITRPNKEGSFGDRWFTYKPEEYGVRPPIPEGTVAIVHNQGGMNPIYIHKDQQAYFIGPDGKTISVINKLPALVVWYRKKSDLTWVKLDKSSDQVVWHLRERNNEDSDHEFLELKVGINPNEIPDHDTANIIWMLNSKGTSKTWRPCSQMEYQMYRYNPDYGFKQCAPGEDPNQVKQEWLK